MESSQASKTKKSFGIIVSGGPAPGINSVISSAVIEAHNRGYTTKGLMNGFRGVSTQEPQAIVDLPIQSVSSIYNKGGSILGTSRFNPLKDAACTENFLNGLVQHDIDKLLVIGGEGSAFLSYQISKRYPHLAIVHVPKTIDNDLILPNKYPSFGFETALYAGAKIVNILREDAKTCRRWFIATTMGRKAGFLSLGIGLASGATATFIPEEFAESKPGPKDIAALLYECIKKRVSSGKNYGVIILAEGILDCLDPMASEELAHCTRDELGRIRYSQVELGDVILPTLKELLRKGNLDIHMITKNIGYELRCCDPVSFDIEYTKFLGYGAVQHMLNGHSGVMVTRDFDKLGLLKLSEMVGPDGLICSRRVDLDSDLYRVARSFMIR